MDNQAFQDQIDALKKEIEILKVRRMYQMDYTPQSVKNSTMGEPNSYVFSGLSTDRPTTGVSLTSTGLGCSIWWSYDTGVLSIWNGSAWLTRTFV